MHEIMYLAVALDVVGIVLLHIAAVAVSGSLQLLKVGIRHAVPILEEEVLRLELAAALNRSKRAVQMAKRAVGQFRLGAVRQQRTLTEHQLPTARHLRGEQVFHLCRQYLVHGRIHDGQNAADGEPAVEGGFIQRVEKFVHVEDSGGF